MQTKHLMGPGSGSEKCDLLTAMAVNGLAAGGVVQSSMMRLMALVTSRYNWTLDELSMGQKEMAQLWSVDERMAKRETKRLIDGGYLSVKRAGVRGRVASYRLNLDRIYQSTESRWTKVGPDFQSRMATRNIPDDKVLRVDFTAKIKVGVATGPEHSDWQHVRDHLSNSQPALFKAWFELLAFTSFEGGCARLTAPSKFAAQYISTHLIGPLEAAFGQVIRGKTRCVVLFPAISGN